MAHDDVYAAVKSDACLMEYGEHLYGRCGIDRELRLRHKMRELGRLLLCSRRTNRLKTMRDHVAPANLMHAVRAVRRASGFDCDTNTYERPSLALKLGCALKAISRLAESRAVAQGDRGAANDARAFRREYNASWEELVSDASFRRDEREAPPLLPFANDIRALHSYLDAQQQRGRRELHAAPTPRNWALLTKITLTQVVLFNRRRTLEVSAASLSAFLSPDPETPEDDGNAALSELEKELGQHFSRMEVRGEKGEKVTVLLTPAMRQALNLLLGKRRECRVPLENTYLFARPLAMDCFQGADALQFFSRFCGAKSPESLTSPKLHRQTEALSRVLNLGNPEPDWLADLLGRDVRVNRQFYRLPEGALQLAKIGKVFMALDRGRLADFQGKSLEDVGVDPDETVQMDGDHVSDAQLPDVVSPPACKKYPERKRRRRWVPEEMAAVHTDSSAAFLELEKRSAQKQEVAQRQILHQE
ncbi:uncharacterized protein LOC117731121 [Cyclopterus lumpus]|uniref:uncharacterized protein LOC117731121 n=1 Tax=Cyclopterus lumpus TaxID=8103 RepID=UPI001486A993|nr:uncharacterized protein LOC117731121 [Cyclopterus lumpus]